MVEVIDVVESLPKPSPAAPLRAAEKKALFDSLAAEPVHVAKPSPAKALFTGLLWAGYAIAIVVAVALVWSAAKGLLRIG